MAAGEWHTSGFGSLTLAKGWVSAVSASKWSDDPFFNALVNMRSHLKSCSTCRNFVGYDGMSPMCITGARLIGEVVSKMDALMRLKAAAIHSAEQIFYPCPDVTRHGDGYALVARPMKAIGTQDGLF